MCSAKGALNHTHNGSGLLKGLVQGSEILRNLTLNNGFDFLSRHGTTTCVEKSSSCGHQDSASASNSSWQYRRKSFRVTRSANVREGSLLGLLVQTSTL